MYLILHPDWVHMQVFRMTMHNGRVTKYALCVTTILCFQHKIVVTQPIARQCKQALHFAMPARKNAK